MSDGRIVITSEPSLSPGEIASRTFATSFRGYDQGEVRHYLERVASELTSAIDRENELKAQIDALRHQAAHPELDEETLTNALGEEAASILRSAREAASDIRAKAEQNVARLVRDAEEEGTRVRADAEGVLSRRVEEADAVAANIRQSAEHDAHELRAHAHAESESELEAARARGKEMIVEAQAVRERVLTDLSRRRRIAHLQVEQLRAGRERLLEAYRVVRRTLDEATDELSVAEAEARIAAEAAARKAAAEAEVTAADIEAELDAVRGTALPLVDTTPPNRDAEAEATAVDVAEETKEAESVDAVDEVEQPAPSDSPEVGDDARPAFEPGPEEQAGGQTDDQPEPPPEERRSSSLRILRPRRHDKAPEDVKEPPPSLVTVEPEEPDEGVRVLTPDASEPSASNGASADTGVEPAPAADITIANETVTDLFARIKADRAEAVAKAQEVLAEAERETPRPDAETEVTAADAPPDPRVPDTDESALQQRDAQLVPLEAALVRKLKRLLQDEQNEVLELLRTVRGRPAPDRVLPTIADQGTRYREAVAPAMADALGAGAGQVVAGDDTDAVELADDLAAELVGELRQRLEAALADVEGSGEDGEGPPDDADVVDRIGAAYRQWKSQRVEALARHHLVWAWSTGSYRATDEAASLRWIVDDEGGPCPDCDDNALAGATPRGEQYPTGQLHPPAHSGCRCLLVPADQ